MKKHYYAAVSSAGIHCHFKSLNGTAWTAYRFDSKDARKSFVLAQNDGYTGGFGIRAIQIKAAEARKIAIKKY